MTFFYKADEHASILKTRTDKTSPASTTYLLRWENSNSGIYLYESDNISTPGRTKGVWTTDAGGKEANLDPPGMVRRKK